jgi:hypothetical protein
MWSGLRAGRGAAKQMRLRVTNLTRHTALATYMEVANSSAKRSKGLLGREGLAHGEGLWIMPCEAVHTFWMQFPIDLVYLDRKRRIRKLVSNLPAWRLSACLRAHSVLELPAGTIRATRTEIGDTLEFSEVSVPGDSSVSTTVILKTL